MSNCNKENVNTKEGGNISMSIKVKLISCIAAFVLVLGIMFGAVLAAEQVQVNIGGSVSFTATSVHAMISGSVSGSTTANTLPNVTVDAETQDGTLAMGGDWSDMHLDFNEAGDDITVTINIQNLSDRTIYVNITDSTAISNVNVTRRAGTNTINATDTNRQITANQTLTYTFNLSIASKDSSVENGAFDLDVNLSSTPQPFNVSISNNFQTTLETTLYVLVDDTEQYSVNYGETVQFNGSKIALSFSPFSVNSLSLAQQNFNIGKVDLYAPDVGWDYGGFYINEVQSLYIASHQLDNVACFYSANGIYTNQISLEDIPDDSSKSTINGMTSYLTAIITISDNFSIELR